MSLEIENMDEFEPEKTQNMELEEYGVWVKKETPEIADDILSDDDIFNPDYFQKIIENSPQQSETIENTVDDSIESPVSENILENLETQTTDISDMSSESSDNFIENSSTTTIENTSDFDLGDLTSEFDGFDLSAFENQFEEKTVSNEVAEINENQENKEEEKNNSVDELPAGFDIPDFSNLSEDIDLSCFMSDFEASIPTPAPKDSSSGSTEEVSLDDFGIDFSNSEFVSLDDFITPTEEKNDIIGDDPLDIQLSFDDNYTSSTGANPLDEMETEFTEGFFSRWDSHINDCERNSCPNKIVLKSGEYLSDVLERCK